MNTNEARIDSIVNILPSNLKTEKLLLFKFLEKYVHLFGE